MGVFRWWPKIAGWALAAFNVCTLYKQDLIVWLLLLLQVQFPERPGALRRFLSALSADYNVTLFHYRNTGNRESYVMLGMQVPPSQDRAFRKVQRSLQDEFTFEELDGEERRVFNMFIS